MAWSQEELEALEKAIAQGALTVKYQDKSVTYRSLDEMIRIRDLMRQDLGIVSGQIIAKKAEFSKGL